MRLGSKLRLGLVVVAAAGMAGCMAMAAMLVKGGTLVKAGFQPKRIIISYRAEGIAPPGAKYLLVETERGEAIFEREANGGGTLIETHWKDEAGDHFSIWIESSAAYEYVVPLDRTQPAKRYIYQAGTYSLMFLNDMSHPVSKMKVEPVTTLIPE